MKVCCFSRQTRRTDNKDPHFTEKSDVFAYGICIITVLIHKLPTLSESKELVYINGIPVLVGLVKYERLDHSFQATRSQERELFLPLLRRCLEDN